MQCSWRLTAILNDKMALCVEHNRALSAFTLLPIASSTIGLLNPPRPCTSPLQLDALAHALHNRALSASTPLPVTSAVRRVPFSYSAFWHGIISYKVFLKNWNKQFLISFLNEGLDFFMYAQDILWILFVSFIYTFFFCLILIIKIWAELRDDNNS